MSELKAGDRLKVVKTAGPWCRGEYLTVVDTPSTWASGYWDSSVKDRFGNIEVIDRRLVGTHYKKVRLNITEKKEFKVGDVVCIEPKLSWPEASLGEVLRVFHREAVQYPINVDNGTIQAWYSPDELENLGPLEPEVKSTLKVGDVVMLTADYEPLSTWLAGDLFVLESLNSPPTQPGTVAVQLPTNMNCIYWLPANQLESLGPLEPEVKQDYLFEGGDEVEFIHTGGRGAVICKFINGEDKVVQVRSHPDDKWIYVKPENLKNITRATKPEAPVRKLTFHEGQRVLAFATRQPGTLDYWSIASQLWRVKLDNGVHVSVREGDLQEAPAPKQTYLYEEGDRVEFIKPLCGVEVDEQGVVKSTYHKADRLVTVGLSGDRTAFAPPENLKNLTQLPAPGFSQGTPNPTPETLQVGDEVEVVHTYYSAALPLGLRGKVLKVPDGVNDRTVRVDLPGLGQRWLRRECFKKVTSEKCACPLSVPLCPHEEKAGFTVPLEKVTLTFTPADIELLNLAVDHYREMKMLEVDAVDAVWRKLRGEKEDAE